MFSSSMFSFVLFSNGLEIWEVQFLLDLKFLKFSG